MTTRLERIGRKNKKWVDTTKKRLRPKPTTLPNKPTGPKFVGA